MSPSSNEIQSVLEQACRSKVFSGYQLYSQYQGKTLSLAGGVTSFWSPSHPVGEGTLFDLGSVTKVIVATSLFALGVQEKKWVLQDPLEKYVPDFKSTSYAKLTLGQLLSHSAGILAWYPLYEETSQSDLKNWFIRNQKKVCLTAPSINAVYSDLGFLLLQAVLEEGDGPLNSALTSKMLSPLKLSEIFYPPLPPSPPAGVVATELREEDEEVLCGRVFDRNCDRLGGICTHAGLFASARGVGRWAEEWLKAWHGRSKWLNQDVARLFTARTGIGTRAYGWDTKSEENSSAGDLFSPETFGHLGYTGASVWIDPKTEMTAVLHTNRVHPSRYDDRIAGVRPQVHNGLVKYWRP